MSAFGELLRAVREQHALSEWELSQSLGVTPQTIFEWESGRATPTVLEIVILRDLFARRSTPRSSGLSTRNRRMYRCSGPTGRGRSPGPLPAQPGTLWSRGPHGRATPLLKTVRIPRPSTA